MSLSKMAKIVNSKSKFVYCGHCDEEVSRTKYYTHKRLYYDRDKKEWSQTKRLNFTITDDPEYPFADSQVQDQMDSEIYDGGKIIY